MTTSVEAGAASRRTGRRAGESGTREAILAAARELFASKGYEGASLRAIAGEAGVDTALIRHFFGSKDDLFAATLELPALLRARIEAAFAGGEAGLGARIARVYLEMWEDPETSGPVLALMRSAATSDKAAARLRRSLAAQMFAMVPARDDGVDPAVRAGLVGSHLAGVAMARHILRVDAIAGLDLDTLVGYCAPVTQRFLTEPLVGP